MKAIVRTAAARRRQECCMCGDHGLSGELFRCERCRFRHQHKYCSNVYPKAESYTLCNWCLHEEAPRSGEKGSESSPSGKITGGNGGGGKKKGRVNLEVMNGGDLVRRKRVISNGGVEEIVVAKRGRSEIVVADRSGDGDVSGGSVTKHGLRNRVRRYKFLDEVCA